ncbi:Hypothetical_protein [Hexamita inflata]|uniref:Hypothetical_protein n=1 Tax=Hexamita inflata TaxID=28002 RepID=A0AA86UIB2_9EUKA|nr:Hypothetical protein HINF_LOCUS44579 [Hexamita inflata]
MAPTNFYYFPGSNYFCHQSSNILLLTILIANYLNFIYGVEKLAKMLKGSGFINKCIQIVCNKAPFSAVFAVNGRFTAEVTACKKKNSCNCSRNSAVFKKPAE